MKTARSQRHLGVLFITDRGADCETTGSGKKKQCLIRLPIDSDTLESYILLTAALSVKLPAPKRKDTVDKTDR